MEKTEIERKVAQAVELHKRGYNCSQCVVMTFAEDLGLNADVAESMSAAFGGGVAKMKEVCGCVSAMAMLAGFVRGNKNQEGKTDLEKTYDWTKSLADEFRNECGEIICKRLREIEAGNTKPIRPCRELISSAVRMVGRKID